MATPSGVIERSNGPLARPAERAAVRVQQFLNAAREIIDEKGSTEFTVQEVVDRSKQSLRSFYQYFDGKHELLLALFEEEMGEAVARVKRVTVDGDPLDRLGRAVLVLYELCSPSEVSEQPLFLEFAQRLLVTHPQDVANAYAPLLEYFVAMVEEASERRPVASGSPPTAGGDRAASCHDHGGPQRGRPSADHRRGDVGVLPARHRARLRRRPAIELTSRRGPTDRSGAARTRLSPSESWLSFQ